MKQLIARLSLLLLASLSMQARAAEPLQAEPFNRYEVLPEVWPDHWLMLYDLTFFKFLEGRMLLVDPLATTAASQFKGMVTASLVGGFERSRKRRESYVLESFYSRGSRGGDRTDTVTIYDNSTLSVQGEIIVPPKRISGMPKVASSGMTPDEKFLLIYNFMPAQSVSVVDMEARKFVTEVSTPGYGFVFPTGERSFFGLGSNGTIRTVHLDENGQATGTETSAKFFDADADPLFESAAVADGRVHFPTFQGRMFSVDARTESPVIGDSWWLTTESERGWRPAGARPVIADRSGRILVLMQPDGAEGTHKNGGSEVWVFDAGSQRRTSRIVLKKWGLSLGATGSGDQQLLSVTNADMGVDIYTLPAGTFVQTLSVAAEAPFLTYGVN